MAGQGDCRCVVIFALGASKVVGIEKPQGLTGIATGIIDDQRKRILVDRGIGPKSFLQHLDEQVIANTSDEEFPDAWTKVLLAKEMNSVDLEKRFPFGQKSQGILE